MPTATRAEMVARGRQRRARRPAVALRVVDEVPVDRLLRFRRVADRAADRVQHAAERDAGNGAAGRGQAARSPASTRPSNTKHSPCGRRFWSTIAADRVEPAVEELDADVIGAERQRRRSRPSGRARRRRRGDRAGRPSARRSRRRCACGPACAVGPGHLAARQRQRRARDPASGIGGLRRRTVEHVLDRGELRACPSVRASAAARTCRRDAARAPRRGNTNRWPGLRVAGDSQLGLEHEERLRRRVGRALLGHTKSQTHFKERGPEMRNPEMLRAPERPRRAAPQGNGRSRHRPAGAVARRAGDAAHRRRDRGAARARAPTTGCTRRSSSIPARFAGFAVLPTADPKAAADELERAVTKLGFKGAMVHGLTDDGRTCSSTTSASGRSSSARRRSTCRSTCTRRCRTRR